MPHSKRNYDNDFKAHAVQLLLGSGKGIKTVARELGVSDGSLRNWKNAFLGASGGPSAVADGGRAAASAQEMADEIRRLRKENEYLRRQREILKKAAAILAEEPHAGIR
ncbi:MAG: transposase [Chthoniobacterales bacterium]